MRRFVTRVNLQGLVKMAVIFIDFYYFIIVLKVYFIEMSIYNLGRLLSTPVQGTVQRSNLSRFFIFSIMLLLFNLYFLNLVFD